MSNQGGSGQQNVKKNKQNRTPPPPAPKGEKRKRKKEDPLPQQQQASKMWRKNPMKATFYPFVKSCSVKKSSTIRIRLRRETLYEITRFGFKKKRKKRRSLFWRAYINIVNNTTNSYIYVIPTTSYVSRHFGRRVKSLRSEGMDRTLSAKRTTHGMSPSPPKIWQSCLSDLVEAW